MFVCDQLNRLADLGMAIPDREQAAHSLRHIGYHWLSSYWQPFLVRSDDGSDYVFREDTEFSDVIEHYNFDRYLRSTLAEALGQIEVSARALWAGHLADEGGDKAHFDPGLFTGREYRSNLPELEQSYRRNAERGSPHWPDATVWQVIEVMSFGQLSKWYETISVRRIRSEIAGHYGLNQRILSSVLYNLAHLRNICAHHSRLWNLNLYTGLRIPTALAAYCNARAKEGLYNRLVIISHLMEIIDPRGYWTSELIDLIEEFPAIAKDRMGFPAGWRDFEFWQG